MTKSIIKLYFLVFTILILSNCKKKNLATPETLLFDSEHLVHVKKAIENGDSIYYPAFSYLINEAELAMKEGPYSVTHKKIIPPSGDTNDYASYSRYWWPDTNKIDSLPYIRRDGITNPNSQSLDKSDRQRLGAFGDNVETLSLAYFFTGDESYATKAAQLLRVWFIDDSTRMNPNLNHAQCRPGHNRGTKSGVLDGRIMIKAIEGSLLINKSSSWTSTDSKLLHDWAENYLDWLTSSEMALEESRSTNNHGTFYDVQTLYFALYSSNINIATNLAEDFLLKRILKQIEADGSMPEEEARTRPLFYSVYNLHAMFLFARLAENLDIDIWDRSNNDSRIKHALDNLTPFVDEGKKWPQSAIAEFDRMELFSILKVADRVYPEDNYDESIYFLPENTRQVHRANLVIPLMR